MNEFKPGRNKREKKSKNSEDVYLWKDKRKISRVNTIHLWCQFMFTVNYNEIEH